MVALHTHFLMCTVGETWCGN